MEKATTFMESVQQTRIDLENGNISYQEMESSIKAWRFIPDRIERMIGSPDKTMWERWEWLHKDGGWQSPHQLLPY